MTISARERRLLIVAGVVLLAALAFFFLSRGGGDDAPVAVDTPAAEPAPEPSPEPSPSPSPTEEPEGEVLVFSGRDPFQPLRATATAGTSGTPTPTVSPAGTPPSGPGGGSSTQIDGHTVVLVDVFRENDTTMVQVEVDGTVYTIGVGETFASNYRLIAVVGTCADFLYGDQAFTLCETSNK